jgi:hypothetical protein
MSDRDPCQLCGRSGPGTTRMSLVTWAAPPDPNDPDDGPYGSIRRCVDEEACRSRLELAGEVWPLTDRIPALER